MSNLITGQNQGDQMLKFTFLNQDAQMLRFMYLEQDVWSKDLTLKILQ